MLKKCLFFLALMSVCSFSLCSERTAEAAKSPSMLARLTTLTPQQKKIALALAGVVTVGAGAYLYGPKIVKATQSLKQPKLRPSRTHGIKVDDYVEKRDLKQLFAMVKPHWSDMVKPTWDDREPALSLERVKGELVNPLWPGEVRDNYSKVHVKTIHDDNRLAGFISYYLYSDGDTSCGYIHWINVAEKFRRKGYTTRLIRHATEDCSKMGARSIFVADKTNTFVKIFGKLGEKLGYTINSNLIGKLFLR